MRGFSTRASRAEIGTWKSQMRRRVRWVGPVIGVEGRGILGTAPVNRALGWFKILLTPSLPRGI